MEEVDELNDEFVCVICEYKGMIGEFVPYTPRIVEGQIIYNNICHSCAYDLIHAELNPKA
jgi:hypothetical protein